jgi:hypothetical protein
VPNINRPSSQHKTGFHTDLGDWWLPYTDDKQLSLVAAAFMEINKQIIDNKGVLKTCNAAFGKLPGGRDFAAVWRDPGIWVSFNPNPRELLWGITYRKDIAIAAYVFGLIEPIRWIAATLVHKLAHVNGAPGIYSDSRAAEETLPPCGFDDKYNPGVVGAVRRPRHVYLA